ncbi:hypothetical protein ACFSFY_13780 [Sporosarcina siberiensis]|uniref:Transcriptional regulator n=1 Tax=Sporosarcina siberiensis TaxID=1365606 RepID=A0ABW4SIH7_9BACL
MITKIAFFGSASLAKRVLNYVSFVPDIKVTPFVYQSPEEIGTLISEAHSFDVYLFSGILPYYITKKNLGVLDKPFTFIADTELNIAMTLLDIKNKKVAELDRISFDIPNRASLDVVISSLDIQPKPVFVFEYPWISNEFTRPFPFSEVLNTHIVLWNTKKIDFVVTSIHALHDELLQLNIPCMRMIDPEKNIIDALLEAKNLAILQQTEHSQVAAGFVSLSTINVSKIPLESHDFLDEKLKSLSKIISCTVQKLEDKSYALYGTKGGIEYLLTNLEFLNDIKIYAHQKNIEISIGFGFGMTIIEAESNAKIALSYSDSKKNKSLLSVHTVTKDKIVMESGDNKPKHFILFSQDENFIQLAKEIGISVTNLNKMIQFTNSRPINRFTSSDIVSYFEITKRSAERMLKKFSDCGYLEIIGEEQPFQHGRPRSVYCLSLPENINLNHHSELSKFH